MVAAHPDKAGRRAPATDQTHEATEAAYPAEAVEGRQVMTGTAPKGLLALWLQSAALVAAGIVVLAAPPAPTASAEQPLQLRWRTATPAEERAYERARLAEVLDQLRTQSPPSGGARAGASTFAGPGR